MRRRKDKLPTTFFRGRERSRFMTMIALLVVLFLLIQRTRRPETWHWLTNGEPDEIAAGPEVDSDTGTANDEAPTKAEPAETTSKANAQVEASAMEKAPRAPEPDSPQEKSQGEITPEPLPKVDETKQAGFYDRFPPDQDDFEQELFAKNRQTVTGRDRALGLDKLEMPAYWQLLRWAKLQSPEAMAKRKTTRLTYDMMIRKPEEHRGELVRLRVNVRRVVKQPTEKGNPLGVDNVYEIIGFNDESQSWLMYCIVPELPEGMPIGTFVNERVEFVGYFLKVQGYQKSEVTPEERYYKCPLFLGRIVWQAPEIKPGEEPTWMWWVLAGAAVTMCAAIAGWIYRPQVKPLVISAADQADRQADLEAFMTNKREPWESEPDDENDPADAWKKTTRDE